MQMYDYSLLFTGGTKVPTYRFIKISCVFKDLGNKAVVVLE